MKIKLSLTAAAAVVAMLLPAAAFADEIEQGSIPVDNRLIELITSMRENNQAWAANEAFLEGGRLEYGIARSSLFPQISVGVDGSGYNTFLNRSTVEDFDLELKNNYSVSAAPKLSVSQLLPTAGVITGSVSDKITGAGLEESNAPANPATDTEFSNQVDIALSISQPLYFGKAYRAAVTQINETREINNLSYTDNRNQLIIAAFNDYYNYLLAAEQLKLVKARLETNLANELRMLSEHKFGLWTEAQLNSARAIRLQSEADLLKAKQSHASAARLLKAIYGIDFDSAGVTNDIDFLPFEAEITDEPQTALAGNTALQIAGRQIRIADAAAVIQKKDSAAVLSLGSNYNISNGIEYEEDGNDSYSNTLSFSVGLSIPAFDGGLSKNSVELKLKEAQRLRSNAVDQQLRTASQLQIYTDNIDVCSKLDEIYLLQQESAVDELERGTKEFELGSITQKDLLELQITLENAGLSILANKIDYNLTVLRIHSLIGHDLLKELTNE